MTYLSYFSMFVNIGCNRKATIFFIYVYKDDSKFSDLKAKTHNLLCSLTAR